MPRYFVESAFSESRSVKAVPESLSQSNTLGEKQLHWHSCLHLQADTRCLRHCVQPQANTHFFIPLEKVDDDVACSAIIPLRCFPLADEGEGSLLHAIKNSIFAPPQYMPLINSISYKEMDLS